MENSLNNKDINNIIRELSKVILAKENICEIVKRNCLNCPLNISDKCSELNLPEFEFNSKENKWVEHNIVFEK